MSIGKGIGTFFRDMFFGLVFLVGVIFLAMMMNNGKLMKELTGSVKEEPTVVESAESSEDPTKPRPEQIKVDKHVASRAPVSAPEVAEETEVISETAITDRGGIKFHSEMELRDLLQTKEIVEAFGYSVKYGALKFSEAGKLMSLALTVTDASGQSVSIESENLMENAITFDPKEMLLVK